MKSHTCDNNWDYYLGPGATGMRLYKYRNNEISALIALHYQYPLHFESVQEIPDDQLPYDDIACRLDWRRCSLWKVLQVSRDVQK